MGAIAATDVEGKRSELGEVKRKGSWTICLFMCGVVYSGGAGISRSRGGE